MFMTAGSCSVMLLCATRRIFCCHGRDVGSMGGRRFGSAMRFGVCSLAGTVSAERVKAGSRTLRPLAKERTAGPVFRKVRRLSIEVSAVHIKARECDEDFSIPSSFVLQGRRQ